MVTAPGSDSYIDDVVINANITRLRYHLWTPSRR